MIRPRSEEHTYELQSPCNLVCRLLLEKKKKHKTTNPTPYSGHTRTRASAQSVGSVSWRPACSGLCVCSRRNRPASILCFFFFNDTATTEIYTLSLHDALPISGLFLGSRLLAQPTRSHRRA